MTELFLWAWLACPTVLLPSAAECEKEFYAAAAFRIQLIERRLELEQAGKSPMSVEVLSVMEWQRQVGDRCRKWELVYWLVRDMRP